MTGPKREFGARGWKLEQLPDLSGKTYVVTGGNSGLGLEASRMLGVRGAAVTIACRNPEKAKEAVEILRSTAPAGQYDLILMDLADLSTIRRAAGEIRQKHKTIDALINNAGIMMVPKRKLTCDGFETQFGVNHLGHFLLNALLADIVEAASGRFVCTASAAHKFAPGFRFDDIMFERGYSPMRAYAQSKLANLSYAFELNRRLETANCKAHAYGCHPGYSETNLQSTGPGALAAIVMKPMTAIMSQSAEKGAIPTVLCAAGLEAKPGHYYGPTAFMELTGSVDRARSTRAAKDQAAARKLWKLSEELTGAQWTIF